MAKKQIGADKAATATLPLPVSSKDKAATAAKPGSDNNDSVPPEIDEDDYDDDLTGLFPNVASNDDQ